MIEYRGYQIKPHKQLPTSYVVATTGQGGKIPDVLGGLFTSTGLIKKLIDQYLEGKTANGKKTNQS